MQIPLIAAGGIGDARGLLGALGMGAEAAYMATAFMATQECPISNRYKNLLVEGQPWDPVVRDRALKPASDREMANVMKSRGSMDPAEWLRSLETTITRSRDTGESLEPAVARAWSDPLEDESGEEVFRNAGGSLAVGVLNDIPTVKEFVDRTIADAERILEERGPLGHVGVPAPAS